MPAVLTMPTSPVRSRPVPRSFDPGNSVLVERMLQAAGAEVLLSTAVTSIQRGGSGRYTVDTNGEAAPRWFDDVVIACPIEFTDITLPA